MKHNSKQFLALFMAASMAVAPVSGVYAEDQNAAVENAVNAMYRRAVKRSRMRLLRMPDRQKAV